MLKAFYGKNNSKLLTFDGIFWGVGGDSALKYIALATQNEELPFEGGCFFSSL